MQVRSLPTILLLVSIGLAALAFAAGYFLGVQARRRKGARNILVLLSILIVGGLLGGTYRLAMQYGSVVTHEAGYISGALEAALLGGYVIGLFRQMATPMLTTILGFLTLILVVVILGFGFALNRQIAQAVHELGVDQSARYEPEKNKDCPANLRSLYTAFSLYAQDWDALPPAGNWLANEELTSKIRQDEWTHCPAVSNRRDARFGYAYNDRVAGHKLNRKRLAQMDGAAKTPLLYDSDNLAKSAHDAFTSLPRPGRHGGRDNILYCDGHVEAVVMKAK